MALVPNNDLMAALAIAQHSLRLIDMNEGHCFRFSLSSRLVADAHRTEGGGNTDISMSPIEVHHPNCIVSILV